MKSIATTLVHKVLPPQKAASGGAPALILLHGRGANEDDLLDLARLLDERLFVLSVRAPYALATGGGYTWYDLLELGRPEPEMFGESFSKLVQFLSDATAGYALNPSKLFLCGFSMGAIMSYAIALTHPESVAGVLAHSGYIPEESPLTFRWDLVRQKPFFVAHGIYDPVIPVMFGRRAKELLERAEAALWYREYDMAHQISEESLNDMSTWLPRYL
jgi:phospholipase/carboxylesterase